MDPDIIKAARVHGANTCADPKRNCGGSCGLRVNAHEDWQQQNSGFNQKQTEKSTVTCARELVAEKLTAFEREHVTRVRTTGNPYQQSPNVGSSFLATPPLSHKHHNKRAEDVADLEAALTSACDGIAAKESILQPQEEAEQAERERERELQRLEDDMSAPTWEQEVTSPQQAAAQISWNIH